MATQDMRLTHGSYSSPFLPTGLDLAFSALIPWPPAPGFPDPGPAGSCYTLVAQLCSTLPATQAANSYQVVTAGMFHSQVRR